MHHTTYHLLSPVGHEQKSEQTIMTRYRNYLSASTTLALMLISSTTFLQAQKMPDDLDALDRILATARYNGTLVLAHSGSGQWLQGTYRNPEETLPPLDIDSAAIPASTFKIFSSLVALQEGVVANADTVIPWDGIERSRTEINQDLRLADAFRYSAVPHYQSMVKTVGEARMQSWLDQAEYGNQNLGGGLTTFWLEGNLRITPRQQLTLLQALNNLSLPFDQSVQKTVKDIMINREESGVVIRGKTGLAVSDNGMNTGWWVGWADDGNQTWYFATLLQASQSTLATSSGTQSDFITARQAVTDQALRLMNVLPPLYQ